MDGTVEILKSGPDRDSAPAVLRTFAIFAVIADGEDGWQIRMLRIYQQAEAADPPGTNHAPVRRERDGQHDFDFEIGSWKTQLSRLVNPLTGSTKWEEHEGTSVVRKVWNGRANLVELDVEGPAGRIEGLSLRLYDPETRQWSLSFANSRSGTMTEPVIGEFRDGRGEFYGRETLNGRAVFVRFIIAPIGTDAWRFEQAFSDDGGKTWEVNWIAIDTRVAHDSGESP